MIREIKSIIEDLQGLKVELPTRLMIGQLKIVHNKGREEITSRRWQTKKRQRGKTVFYNVTYEKSTCVSSGIFVSHVQLPQAGNRQSLLFQDALSIKASEVERFINEAEDNNPIHKGEHALVPGLLLLEKVLSFVQEEASCVESYTVSFKRPLYVGETYSIEKENRHYYLLNKTKECIVSLTVEENNE